MEKFKVFKRFADEVKKDNDVIAILLSDKAALLSNEEFDELHYIDVIVVYSSNLTSEREYTKIDGLIFDVRYISIFDLITYIEKNSRFWINDLARAKVYYAKNEIIFGLIDKVKSIYLNGTKKLSDEEIEYIRFDLTLKMRNVYLNRNCKFLIHFLVEELFIKIIESYYTLHSIWLPELKNIFNNLRTIDYKFCDLTEKFILSNSIDDKIENLDLLLDYLLKPFGGDIDELEKKEYKYNR